MNACVFKQRFEFNLKNMCFCFHCHWIMWAGKNNVGIHNMGPQTHRAYMHRHWHIVISTRVRVYVVAAAAAESEIMKMSVYYLEKDLLISTYMLMRLLAFSHWWTFLRMFHKSSFRNKSITHFEAKWKICNCTKNGCENSRVWLTDAKSHFQFCKWWISVVME